MNNRFNNHLVIIFALEHYNPLGLIRSLGENGIDPIYISIKRRGPVACMSKYISICHFVNSVEEGYEICSFQHMVMKSLNHIFFFR